MEKKTFDGIVTGFPWAATGAISWDAALLAKQEAFGARVAVLHTAQMSTGRLLALRYTGIDAHEAVIDYVIAFRALQGLPRSATDSLLLVRDVQRLSYACSRSLLGGGPLGPAIDRAPIRP